MIPRSYSVCRQQRMVVFDCRTEVDRAEPGRWPCDALLWVWERQGRCLGRATCVPGPSSAPRPSPLCGNHLPLPYSRLVCASQCLLASPTVRARRAAAPHTHGELDGIWYLSPLGDDKVISFCRSVLRRLVFSLWCGQFFQFSTDNALI